jgi:hypothetical protein
MKPIRPPMAGPADAIMPVDRSDGLARDYLLLENGEPPAAADGHQDVLSDADSDSI